MEFRTRKVVKPGDLNSMNALFGGRLLEWVDEECLIYCGCQLQHTRLVTKYISEINFVGPAQQNDVVEIGVDTVSVGRTSITVRCEVRNRGTRARILSIDRIVFVALDSTGRPTAHRLARLQDRSERTVPLRQPRESDQPKTTLLAEAADNSVGQPHENQLTVPGPARRSWIRWLSRQTVHVSDRR